MESKRLGKTLEAYRNASVSKKTAKQLSSRLASSRKWPRKSKSSDEDIQKQDDPIGSGKVTCSALNVRNGAGTNYDRIGGLTNGKGFQVYEEKDGWLKIKYGTGFGWISKKYTDYKTPEPPKPPFTPYEVEVTDSDGLNVRDVPGNGGTPAEGSTVLGVLTIGTVVKVLEEKNGWFRIEYEGKEGWICGDFVAKYDPGSNPEVSTDGVPLYSQGDSRWSGDYMGKSGCTIGQIGCAMTSTTMALNKISGQSFTPKDMNNYLNNQPYGYTSDGDIYWNTAAQYVKKSYTNKAYSKTNVDAELNAGRPVVISVKNAGHWVCVAGRKSDGSYTIHDPAGGKVLSGSWAGDHIKVSGYNAGYDLCTFG